jgi:hypothetical protein
MERSSRALLWKWTRGSITGEELNPCFNVHGSTKSVFWPGGFFSSSRMNFYGNVPILSSASVHHQGATLQVGIQTVTTAAKLKTILVKKAKLSFDSNGNKLFEDTHPSVSRVRQISFLLCQALQNVSK